MSLEHAILGFLAYGPMSGYDLKSVFDKSVRHFWPADQSQIYRSLSRLSESKWVDVRIVEQDERPDRKVYSITKLGEEELDRWLTSPIPHKQTRLTELIAVFFAGRLNDEQTLELFSDMAEKGRGRLNLLEAIETHCDSERKVCSHRDEFFWGLTLEYGIHMTKASIEWAESVIARIERREHMEGAER